MQIVGCYKGKSSKGEPVRGRVDFMDSWQPERFDEIRIAGKRIDYLNIAFVIGEQNGDERAIITQVFEPGTIINSQILNNQVSYKHFGNIERFLDGNVMATMANESLLTVKNENHKNLEFQIHQNDNSEFIREHYAGRRKASIQFLHVDKINCKH